MHASSHIGTSLPENVNVVPKIVSVVIFKIKIMCGLRGPEAYLMTSQTLNILMTRALTETYANKDISIGNKEEGCLAFDEAVRFYQRDSE